MAQQGTTGAQAGGADAVVGATTEFEPDVVELLEETVRKSVRRGLPVVGTDTVLAHLVLGDWEAGAALAPGMRKAGSLSGLIAGRAGEAWVSDDAAPADDVPAEAPADDVREVDAAWREAGWRFSLGRREPAAEGGSRELPPMSGALRACLLHAVAAARTEGTVSVRCRHVARALLELPDTRAREALVLQRLDPTAAAAALDRLDAGAAAETERPESRSVLLLRRAGTVGRSGNPLSRALTSWTSGSSVNGSPMVFAVTVEASRQAVRCGRTAAEPVDFLLGALALDRALSVAGHALPAKLAKVNSAAPLLRRHGLRQSDVVAASAAPVPADAGAEGESVQPSAAAKRIVSVAQLTAAEHGAPTVGTVHLLAALLDEAPPKADAGAAARGEVVRLLTAVGVDVPALRTELDGRLGA